MRKLALVAVMLIAVAVPMSASALTKDQAWKRAKGCLLKNGAGFVSRRADGGGFAAFTRGRGSTFWTYKTSLGQVESVTVYFAGRPGPNAKLRAATKRCLLDGV